MPNNNQKLKILYILKILMEQTDENHPLSTNDLIAALKHYDVDAERKSIYTDIECLQDFGIDIICEKARSNQYYIGSREFELAELKLLVDSVQSSKFITHKKSRELIKKLEKLASKHEGGALQRQVTVHKRVKSMNESIYYSVDAIHEAIKNKKKVDFKYYSYDVDKNFKPRRNGATYSVVPFALSWADENYYLIGYYDRYDDVSNFRVDRMDQVCVSKEDVEVLPAYENFDVIDYTNKMFGMFGGNLERVKIKFSHEMVNLVIDKFGKDITIYDKDNCHFCVSLDLAITNTFFSWMVIFGSVGSTEGAEQIGAGLATAIIMPHLVLIILSALFGFLGFFLRKDGFNLTSGILYSVATALFLLYFMFTLPLIVLSFVGYSKQKQMALSFAEEKVFTG